MAATRYHELLKEIDQLPLDQQRLLLGELMGRLEHGLLRRHSILEFRGIGKANPVGMDAQAYVDKERDTWEQEQHP